jgi:hypothetical protein
LVAIATLNTGLQAPPTKPDNSFDIHMYIKQFILIQPFSTTILLIFFYLVLQVLHADFLNLPTIMAETQKIPLIGTFYPIDPLSPNVWKTPTINLKKTYAPSASKAGTDR